MLLECCAEMQGRRKAMESHILYLVIFTVILSALVLWYLSQHVCGLLTIRVCYLELQTYGTLYCTQPGLVLLTHIQACGWGLTVGFKSTKALPRAVVVKWSLPSDGQSSKCWVE